MPASPDNIGDFWTAVPLPDWDKLWSTPENPWFHDMAHGAGDVLLTLVIDNWGFVVFGFTLFFALTVVPAMIRRFRWGPGSGDDAHGQGSAKV